MNKRPLVLLTIFVFAVGAIGAFIFMKEQPGYNPETESTRQESKLTPNHYEEARATPTNGVKCLEENSLVDLTTEERTDIEYKSMAHLFDIPAGTNLDVKIATYSADEVTGSNQYEGDYGNYNFVLSRQNKDWVITEYLRCEN